MVHSTVRLSSALARNQSDLSYRDRTEKSQSLLIEIICPGRSITDSSANNPKMPGEALFPLLAMDPQAAGAAYGAMVEAKARISDGKINTMYYWIYRLQLLIARQRSRATAPAGLRAEGPTQSKLQCHATPRHARRQLSLSGSNLPASYPICISIVESASQFCSRKDLMSVWGAARLVSVSASVAEFGRSWNARDSSTYPGTMSGTERSGAERNGMERDSIRFDARERSMYHGAGEVTACPGGVGDGDSNSNSNSNSTSNEAFPFPFRFRFPFRSPCLLSRLVSFRLRSPKVENNVHRSMSPCPGRGAARRGAERYQSLHFASLRRSCSMPFLPNCLSCLST